MTAYRRSARRLLLTTACIASALIGMAAVWLLAPSGFKGVPTGELLTLMVLLWFPLLTAMVTRRDRAAQGETAEPEPSAPAAIPAVPSEAQAQRVPRKSVIHEPAYLPQAGESQRV